MLELGYQVEVDRATPAEWSEMLDLFCDANIYQTWSYGRVRWGEKNLSHLVLKQDGEVVGMAQLRIIRPTMFKFGMAYLRWGPLCHRIGRAFDPTAPLHMVRALQKEYVTNRGLMLRVLPNAFVGSQRAALFQSAFRGFEQEFGKSAKTHRTFILDLAPSLEDLRRKLDRKWRNQLSRAEKNGLTVVAGSGTNEYREFCRMYCEMRKRKAFETNVDIEEFGRIQQNLPELHRMRILICERQGTPVAGLVASVMGDSAIYLLGATSDIGLESKGAYLLQWTLIQRLKESGIKSYDLGGIDPWRNPGVYHFKQGLSGTDVSHMNPLVACNSVLAAAIIRTIEAAHRGLHVCAGRYRRARALTSSAICNST